MSWTFSVNRSSPGRDGKTGRLGTGRRWKGGGLVHGIQFKARLLRKATLRLCHLWKDVIKVKKEYKGMSGEEHLRKWE